MRNESRREGRGRSMNGSVDDEPNLAEMLENATLNA
jgi:hypothetical protein